VDYILIIATVLLQVKPIV